MNKRDILSQTLNANYKINEKASLLSINQCRTYIQIVTRHLKEVLNRLNEQKKIILCKISPTLSSDVVRLSGLVILKKRMDEMIKFIDSCEVNGRRTIASSDTINDDNRSILFPMTSGLVFTEEPKYYDINTQNLVFKLIFVGLSDLGLLSFYQQLSNYIEKENITDNCSSSTDNESNTTQSDSETTECNYLKNNLKNNSENNLENNLDNNNLDNISDLDNISNLDNISDFDNLSDFDTNSSDKEIVDIDNYYNEKMFDKSQYTKYVYVWKYKFEKSIEKVAELIDILNSHSDVLEMRKNFIIAETQDKIALNNLFL